MGQSGKKINGSRGENTSHEDGWLEFHHWVAPWGNPESSESKLVFVSPGGKTIEVSILIHGDKTITEAGYEALDLGLKMTEGMAKKLRILSDSKLFNRQSTDEDDHLRTLRDGIINRLQKFDCYEVLYLPMKKDQEIFRVVLQKLSPPHG
jgi:hypothetical protein